MKATSTPAPAGAVGTASGSAPGWRAHAPWLAALLLFLLPGYGRLLVGDEGAISRDYGMLFLDALTQQRDALLDGHVLLWDPSQVGGTAFWPLPNQAPLYPPLMACLLVRGAIEGLNLCLFLHVAWGALGTYVLVNHLGRRRLAALVGGVLFAYAYFTRHLADILPLEALAGSWIPWAACFLCRAQTSPRWLRWSALAGLAYAGVAWLGGFIQFLPGMLVLGTIVLVATVRAGSRERWGRACASLIVFTGLVVLVSAGKVLPMWHWIALTDRAGGIQEEFALGGSLDDATLRLWILNEGWVPLGLFACGLVLGAFRRDSWCAPFAAAAVLLVLIADGPLYKVLYDYVPGFRYVRDPERVWLLMPAVLPVAAALGLAGLQERVRLSGPRAVLAGGLVLALVAADMIAWPRYAQQPPMSLSARLTANALHQDLARRAQEEPRFRVIAIEKARARTKQTADLMRSSLGLESMEGILGNVAIQAYDIDYLNVVRDTREARFGSARLLGLMNCRYVTATEPIEEPGFTLVQEFPPDLQRPFKGIDGPLLYRDDLALPRASLADHALLLVGGTAAQQAQLLRMAIWDPRRIVLIRAEPDVVAALPAGELRRFDGALFLAAGEDALRERLQAEGVRCFAAAGADPADQGQWLLGVMSAPTAPLQALPDPPRAWNAQHVSLPADAGGRWLLLAETFALYPGWTAEVDGQPAALFAANAVTTAIPLPPGAREVSLSYVPPGLVTGLGLTLAGLLLAGLAIRRPARRA